MYILLFIDRYENTRLAKYIFIIIDFHGDEYRVDPIFINYFPTLGWQYHIEYGVNIILCLPP